MLQTRIQGCIVGINVLDKPGRTFRHSIFPGLPEEFARRLEGNVIDGKRGSCGLGVLTGKVIYVTDVASDERFSDDWKALFARYELSSLISMPAITSDGEVHGSIAVIHPKATLLQSDQINSVKAVAALCAKICAYSRTLETNQILLGELEHRIRNLYLTVGGVANLTIKRYPDPGEFRRVFSERLNMMHRAHSLALVQNKIELSQLIEQMLAPYSKDYDVSIRGPEIILAPDAACALALAVHELGTNASKYGALSLPGGTLEVEWNILATSELDCLPTFILRWDESRGPLVKQPTRKGYGTIMIGGALRNAFDGKVVFTFEPCGFSCEISAPFSSKLGKGAISAQNCPLNS
ncbi:HWE histidine kinase domain-containing protein [Pseudomonas sp. CFSAN084952]|uniref:HWE histidine kinase domain-containing protein n=1 Tax=Pseudomonas TaxID=286 RepID=UPI002115B295|nr:HWE histidine kinase domain-containing protein [Pseudomonas sp. CFSAN084952]